VVMDVVKTPERTGYLNFTKPYVKISTVIITRDTNRKELTLDKLDGLKIGVTEEFQIIDYLKENYPSLKPVLCKNTPEALNLLSRGDLDVIISELPTASYIIENNKITNLRIAGYTGHTYNLSIGTRKDWPILNTIISKGLALITEKEKQEIRNKWISLQGKKSFPVEIPVMIFILILFFSLIVLLHRRKVFKKIKNKFKKTVIFPKWYIFIISIFIVIALIILFTLNKPVYFQKDILSTYERTWLKDHDGKIRFALTDDYPPFDFIDEKDKYSGLSADYIRLIEKKLNFRFKMVYVKEWTEVMKMAKSSRIDVISSIQKTQERSEFLLFTEPYLDVYNVIITRKEFQKSLTLDTMQGMKVSVVENFAIYDYLKKNYGYLDITLCKTPFIGLTSVSFKNTDAIILDMPVASYYISKKGISNLRVAGFTNYIEKFRIASIKSSPVLNKILNKGLTLVTASEHEELRDKWLYLKQEPVYKTEKFWIVVSIPSIITILIIISILFWSRSLKRLVKERTRDLKNELEERKKTEIELKKSKEEAESANRVKTEFIANISHEIRTPLHVITGFGELLELIVVDKKQISYIKAIITAGRSLMMLINDILDLSKIEAKMLILNPVPVSVKIIIDEIIQIFTLKIAEKNIFFEIEIDGNLSNTLILDEIRLRQVLLNLVGNAVKFTENGKIKISAKQKNTNKKNGTTDLIISLIDTGIGIPQADLEIIFESFVQQESVFLKDLGGTGLGLAICKRLVEIMNGTISVESVENEGSTFEVVLKDVPLGKKDEYVTEHEVAIKTVKPAISLKEDEIFEVLEKSPNCLYEVKKNILPSLKNLQQGMIMASVQEFGKTLCEAGKKHDINHFIKNGEDLIEHAENFDIENLDSIIRKLLNQLEKLVKKAESNNDE